MSIALTDQPGLLLHSELNSETSTTLQCLGSITHCTLATRSVQRRTTEGRGVRVNGGKGRKWNTETVGKFREGETKRCNKGNKDVAFEEEEKERQREEVSELSKGIE